MGLNNLIAIATTMAFLTASTGQLPKAIRAVQIAQLQLIKQSQASKWPKAMRMPGNQ